MTESERQIAVPAQYAIDGQVLENPVRQLRRPVRLERVTLATRRVRRTDAHALERADGTAVLLIDRRVAAPDDVPELLYSKNPGPFVRGETSDLEADWLAPAAHLPHRQIGAPQPRQDDSMVVSQPSMAPAPRASMAQREPTVVPVSPRRARCPVSQAQNG